MLPGRAGGGAGGLAEDDLGTIDVDIGSRRELVSRRRGNKARRVADGAVNADIGRGVKRELSKLDGLKVVLHQKYIRKKLMVW